MTLGALANVLDTLGMVDDLALVARADQLGHQLQDARVQATQRVRTSRRKDDREERVLERLADPRGDASSRTTRKTIL